MESEHSHRANRPVPRTTLMKLSSVIKIVWFVSATSACRAGVDVKVIAERKAHEKFLTCAIFNEPRGDLIATGSEQDGMIKLWDAKTAEPKLILSDEFKAARSFVFYREGGFLASIGRRPEICLWDVRAPASKFQLIGHEGWVYDLAATPNGKYLVSAGEDWTIRVWDMQTFRQHRLVKTVEHLDNPFIGEGVKSLAISSDGSKVATCCGGDGSIRLWSLPDLKPIDVFRIQSSAYAMAFPPMADILCVPAAFKLFRFGMFASEFKRASKCRRENI